MMKGNTRMNILFQGDSVTDSNRNRQIKEANNGFGTGYVNLIASRLLCDHPDWKIYNRGIGGNRIGDMYARWIEDTLNIDFDLLSVLNGINDVGFGLRLNMGADADEFEFMYDRMLSSAVKTHKGCKLVLLEPFIMKYDLREKNPNMEDKDNDIFLKWDEWSKNILERSERVQRLAKKYNAVFVPLFNEFADLGKNYGCGCWTVDCIHPTPAGHEFIARQWLNACKSILN